MQYDYAVYCLVVVVISQVTLIHCLHRMHLKVNFSVYAK